MIAASASRLRLIGAGVLIVVFAAGGLAGAAVHTALADRAQPEQATRERQGERDGNTRRPSIYDRLSLSPAQDSAVDAIFARQARQANRIWRREFEPVMDSLVTTARADVRALLTPAQTVTLDSLLAAIRDRRRSNSTSRQPMNDMGAGGNSRPRKP